MSWSVSYIWGPYFILTVETRKMFLLFWLGTIWMKLKGGSIACTLVAIEDMELQYLLWIIFKISFWDQTILFFVSGRFIFVHPWVGLAQAHLVSTVEATRIKSNPRVYTRNGGRNQNWNAQPMNCLPHRPWKYWCPLSQVILDVLVLFLLRHMLFSQHTFLFLKEIWVNFLLVLCFVLLFIVETVYEY